MVSSENERMRATMYPAAGDGPHPTVLLLHGFPGGPGWSWIAGPLRDAGFNVLFLHPRGMWGSEGEFTLANALADGASALSYLRTEEARSTYRIDPDRLILVGHSFGGWLALNTAAGRPEVRCVAALTPANLGRYGERWGAEPQYRAAWTASLQQVVEGEGAVVRTSHGAAEFVRYLSENAGEYDVRRTLGALRDQPVLLLGARADRETPLEDHHRPILEAFESVRGARLTEVVLPTDHGFTNRRDLLASTVTGWLRHECLSTLGDPTPQT